MRRKLVAGNWKMHTTLAEARRLAAEVVAGLSGGPEVEVALCPPFTVLAAVSEVLAGSPVCLGAQDCWYEPQGAFTGEISPVQLLDLSCRYVIIGHSERRHVIGETGELIGRKVRGALAAGLEVIFCVGETLPQREAGRTREVVGGQLDEVFDGMLAAERVVVAYEPVWAIGTGRNATPQQAQEVHRFIRQSVGAKYNEEFASRTRILYGGSVRPDNAADLMGQSDVDGALVGGASLKAGDFCRIVEAASPAGR